MDTTGAAPPPFAAKPAEAVADADISWMWPQGLVQRARTVRVTRRLRVTIGNGSEAHAMRVASEALDLAAAREALDGGTQPISQPGTRQVLQQTRAQRQTLAPRNCGPFVPSTAAIRGTTAASAPARVAQGRNRPTRESDAWYAAQDALAAARATLEGRTATLPPETLHAPLQQQMVIHVASTSIATARAALQGRADGTRPAPASAPVPAPALSPALAPVRARAPVPVPALGPRNSGRSPRTRWRPLRARFLTLPIPLNGLTSTT